MRGSIQPDKASVRLADVRRALHDHAHPERARVSRSFFKTGKGEYGEGDRFIGVSVPVMRKIARSALGLREEEIVHLLSSSIHEERFVGLIILVMRFQRGDATEQGRIHRFYLRYRKAVNNWDLVDTSTPFIIGQYLLGRSTSLLLRFAKSRNVWERRMAILATFAFIREGQYADALCISKILMTDSHDLIHKAVGWMLREVGKRSKETLTGFLDQYANAMPRTMLRYAIEKFPERERKGYLTAKTILVPSATGSVHKS